MKSFLSLKFQPTECKKELAAFRKLLDQKTTLSERKDILPFFRTNLQLAALVGSFNPRILRFDRVALEFNLFGDFSCDLAIGDSTTQNYCFVEFEDASPSSIFCKKKSKATLEWAARFEHGSSQIIDWFQILEDQQRTGLHKSRFDADVIQYVGLLVIGRKNGLKPSDVERLCWRSEHVRVGARQLNCITFDDLYETLKAKLEVFSG